MQRLVRIIIPLIAVMAAATASAQLSLYREWVNLFPADGVVPYRVVNGIELDAHIFLPPGYDSSGEYPTAALFHGGGLARGLPHEMYPQAYAMSQMGMIAVSFEYRLAQFHGATPIDAIQDGKEALRWLHGPAGVGLGVDPGRIVAGGNSAGGILAVMIAQDRIDPLVGLPMASSSSKPDAVLLFGAPSHTGPVGYLYPWLTSNGYNWQDFSPEFQLGSEKPVPHLALVASDDWFLQSNLETETDFKYLGYRFDLHVHPGGGHTFYYYITQDLAPFQWAMTRVETFLNSEGIL